MISETRFQLSGTKHSTSDNGTSWCIQPEKEELDWNKDATAPARLRERGFAAFCTGTPSLSQTPLDSAAVVTSSERVRTERKQLDTGECTMLASDSWVWVLSRSKGKRSSSFCVFSNPKGGVCLHHVTRLTIWPWWIWVWERKPRLVHACEHRIRLWILPLGF